MFVVSNGTGVEYDIVMCETCRLWMAKVPACVEQASDRLVWWRHTRTYFIKRKRKNDCGNKKWHLYIHRLTHCGLVPQEKWVNSIIVGLSPVRYQSIVGTNDDLLLLSTGHLEPKVHEMRLRMQFFFCSKTHLKMSPMAAILLKPRGANEGSKFLFYMLFHQNLLLRHATPTIN